MSGLLKKIQQTEEKKRHAIDPEYKRAAAPMVSGGQCKVSWCESFTESHDKVLCPRHFHELLKSLQYKMMG